MTTGAPRVMPVDDPATLDTVIEAIRADRLVALPTETVYGLACGLNDAAVDRLMAAKGRDPGKGITLLIDTLADAARLVIDSPAAARLASRFWPGPLTLIVPLRVGVVLPYAVTGGSDAVGLRVPDQALARALARELGPLPLTSANRSGEPDARDTAAGPRPAACPRPSWRSRQMARGRCCAPVPSRPPTSRRRCGADAYTAQQAAGGGWRRA